MRQKYNREDIAIALCTQTENYLSPNRLLSGNTVKRKCLIQQSFIILLLQNMLYVSGGEKF